MGVLPGLVPTNATVEKNADKKGERSAVQVGAN
jgi:hypothetical protein